MKFHISDVLTIGTGRLVSTRHLEGVYDILNYMTGDNLFTHVLPRAMDVCQPVMVAAYPWLAEVDTAPLADLPGERGAATRACAEWVGRVSREHLGCGADTEGAMLEVPTLETWNCRNPIEELAEMVGAERVAVVVADPKEV